MTPERAQRLQDCLAVWAAAARQHVAKEHGGHASKEELTLCSSTMIVYEGCGDVRGPHVDPGEYDIIVSQSLTGAGTTTFERHGSAPIVVHLLPGTTIAFSNALRWHWTHDVRVTSGPRIAIVHRFKFTQQHPEFGKWVESLRSSVS